MGVRLFKKLGWGLTGLECDKDGALTDSRINADALKRGQEDAAVEYLMHLEGLRSAEEEHSDAWFDLTMSIEMIKAALEEEECLPWPVTRSSESGRRDLLLVQPVGFTDWTRYGDRIDQAEENALHPDEYYRIVPMPHGIYPFEGLYMDSRNGRHLDRTATRMIGRLLEKQKTEEDQKYRAVADKLAKTLGFDDAEQAQRCIAPIVPSDIQHVCSWLNLFNEPDAWLQLRPMLYIYWS